MKKLLMLILICTCICSSTVLANEIKITNTWKKTGEQTVFSPNYETGIERFAYVVSTLKHTPVTIEYLQIQTSDKNQTRYKIRLNSQVNWIQGNWIIDVVPYTEENMSIETARKKNQDYDFWYVVYNDFRQPIGVAWARYGRCNYCQAY